jgi:hypothetical protein
MSRNNPRNTTRNPFRFKQNKSTEIIQNILENYKIAETQRELEDLEIEEQNEIMTGRPTVRQAWR